MVRTLESFSCSRVTSAVMSLVVEAMGRSRRAWRWKTTSPVVGSTRMAAGARIDGGAAGAIAGLREREGEEQAERGQQRGRRRARVTARA